MCIKSVVDNESFNRLQSLAKEKAKNMLLNEREEFRVERELSIIQEGGASDIFLCLYDTMLALKECGVVFHGLIHCSFLCYVLGLSKVNPFDYGLVFERFYHKNKKFFPLVGIAVPFGMKEKAADILAQRNFTLEYNLEEAKISECRIFTDEEIYQKVLSTFPDHDFEFMKKYQGIEEVEEIFSKPNGRFIYQEHFFEICKKFLWVNSTKAVEFRKSMVMFSWDLSRREKDRGLECFSRRFQQRQKEVEEIKNLFSWRADEEGVELFEYLQKGMWYAVSKAYIIGLLFLDFTI